MRWARRDIKNAKSLVENSNTGKFLDECLTILDTLTNTTTSLTDSLKFERTLEDLVLSDISLIGEKHSDVQRLLSHYKTELKTIVRDVLSSTKGNEPKFLRTVKECYKQATDKSGALCCERCFDYIDEASLDSPYDADYESERYYKHEDHMQIDKSYARSKHMCKERQYLETCDSTAATSARYL